MVVLEDEVALVVVTVALEAIEVALAAAVVVEASETEEAVVALAAVVVVAATVVVVTVVDLVAVEVVAGTSGGESTVTWFVYSCCLLGKMPSVDMWEPVKNQSPCKPLFVF